MAAEQKQRRMPYLRRSATTHLHWHQRHDIRRHDDTPRKSEVGLPAAVHDELAAVGACVCRSHLLSPSFCTHATVVTAPCVSITRRARATCASGARSQPAARSMRRCRHRGAPLGVDARAAQSRAIRRRRPSCRACSAPCSRSFSRASRQDSQHRRRHSQLSWCAPQF